MGCACVRFADERRRPTLGRATLGAHAHLHGGAERAIHLRFHQHTVAHCGGTAKTKTTSTHTCMLAAILVRCERAATRAPFDGATK